MKDCDPDDPMEALGQGQAGDPELMLACLVEEYAALGYGETAILGMFSDPFFQAARMLRGTFGPEGLRERIGRVMGRCGVLKVRAQVAAGPDDASGPQEEMSPALAGAPARRNGGACE